MNLPSLQFDLGNTRVKWRLVEGKRVIARGDGEAILHTTPDWRDCDPLPRSIAIASVAAPTLEAELQAQVQRRFSIPPWFARSVATAGGLKNSYREPSRMGVDRWLAMLGAWSRFRRRLCVIDGGSALTIDLVHENGRHEGGYIIPGAALMERALLRDTQHVRYESSGGAALAPGQSTAECVEHGVTLAQCGAIRLALDEASAAGTAPLLLFTGGAGRQLLQLCGLKGALFEEDLVFDGLTLAASLAAAED